MDFNQNIAGNFGSQQSRQGQGQQGPLLPPPWVSRWDETKQHWLYINEHTGERTFQHPQPGYGPPQSGYGSQQPGYGSQQPGYSSQARYPAQEQPKSSNHNLAYGAAGVAAGLVGGALLMHEGEKLRMPARSI